MELNQKKLIFSGWAIAIGIFLASMLTSLSRGYSYEYLWEGSAILLAILVIWALSLFLHRSGVHNWWPRPFEAFFFLPYFLGQLCASIVRAKSAPEFAELSSATILICGFIIAWEVTASHVAPHFAVPTEVATLERLKRGGEMRFILRYFLAHLIIVLVLPISLFTLIASVGDMKTIAFVTVLAAGFSAVIALITGSKAWYGVVNSRGNQEN